MKIEAIHIHAYQKKFNLHFPSGHLERTKPDSLIVKFDFDNGISGVSETTPRGYVTGETIDTVVQTLRMWATEMLFTVAVNTIEDVTQLLSDLKQTCVQKKSQKYLNALTVVDLALFDALGKQQQLAAGKLLGTFVRESIPYGISVPFFSLEEIKALYPIFAPFNISFIKVLLGDDDAYNVEKVKLLRTLLGDAVVIQAEINGYWSFEQAVTTLEKVSVYNISAVEQPFPAGIKNIAPLIELKKRTGLPIILDESICDLADAKHFLESNAVDVINIKIAKCGGLLQSRQIADLAKAHGKMCHLGAHVGETAILTNAGLHFAMTTENIRFFEGLSFILFQDLDPASLKAKASSNLIRTADGLGVTAQAYEKLLFDCEWIATIN